MSSFTAHLIGAKSNFAMELPVSRKLMFPLVLLLALAAGCTSSGGGSSQPPNPVPVLSGVTPNSASAGSPALTITASGSEFISTSVIEWNGSPLATTYVSSTSLTGQVPASDLSSGATATVTVQTPPPGGGTSGNLTFTVSSGSNLTVLDIEGSDLAWNASQQKLYVAVPASATADAGTITVVDPVAGSIGTSLTLSSAPSGLAISDDDQYLYAVINGAATIERLNLPTLTPDIQWSLGTDSSSGQPNLAGDIKVQPGASHTLAVSFGQYGVGKVAVFDNAVERSAVAGGIVNEVGNSLQWKADGTELYAAYTIGNDSPYFTTVSDDALYTMPVTSNGVGSVTTYNAAFRSESVHLHSDPATGYVYGDYGQIIDSASGIPVGNYGWNRPTSTYLPGPMSIVDPSLKLFFTLLEVSEPDGTSAFQIQRFGQTQFHVQSTMVIPNVVGRPTNFIRWGQSGLAVVTNGSTGIDGKLYILDGNFVNPSGAPDTSVGTLLNPVPTVTALSPLTATAGTTAVGLTITGRDFIGSPTVYWNGSALPTTLVSSTELSAQIPVSDLASVSQAMITVSNAGSTSLASNAVPFSVNSAPPTGTAIAVYGTGGNDLVWDANTARIYVSEPSVQGDTGDTIAIVDPVGGTVTNSTFVGSDPARLSVSADGQSLYTSLYGQNAIEQLALPALPNVTVNTLWNLGGVGTFSGPYYALDLQADPASSQTTAVILANFDISPSSVAVVVFDGSTPRSNELQATQFPYSSLQWSSDGSALYSVDQQIPQDLLALGVGASGVVLNQHYNGIVSPYSARLHYDGGTGLVYSDGGQAIQPSTGTVVGSYGASGIAVPDSTLDRVFILGQTAAQSGTSSYTIESFNQTTFAAVGSVTIDNLVGTPTALIRWGSNGLALATRVGNPNAFIGIGPGQLYVISGGFVASARSGESSSTVPFLPVRKTWNLASPLRKSPARVVQPNPMAR